MFATYKSHILVGVVCLLIGGIVGYNLVPDQVVFVEKPAPSFTLPSGALVAERMDIHVDPPKPIKVATKELKGELVRAGSVKVKPTQEECPPVKIDWGLVRLEDEHRMVFTTEDGSIVGATDIPVRSMTVTKHPKWTVGAIAPVDNYSGVGPMVQRHFGRLSVGAAAVKTKQDEWTGMVSVGVSW